MEKWKLNNFVEKAKYLLQKGKGPEYFKSVNDKTISSRDFIDLLFYTLHPFEIKGYVKILSPIQKAITMAIYLNGGLASEDEIVNFLSQHWLEITNVSRQNYVKKPNSKLLRLNMAIKKKGLKLFVKKPNDSKMIEVNTADAGENIDYISDDSNQEESRPMKSRERSKKSSLDNDGFNSEANNSDNSYFDIDLNRDDIDDNDDIKGSDLSSKTRRNGRWKGKSKNDNPIPLTASSVKETRSKKDRKASYSYSPDEKDKQSQNKNEYSGNTKYSDYHYTYGRGNRRLNSEQIHQNSSQPSQAPVKTVGKSVNMMKINSTLILPPAQKVPPPFYSLLPSDSTIENRHNEKIDIGTGLAYQWRWCNFNMTTAERILFYPLSKPLESSIESMQNDTKFDFEIPSHLNFDDMVIFVVEEASSRASASNSFLDAASCGVTIDQIIEKIDNFKDKQGAFMFLPITSRVRAILLEAKNEKILENKFSNQKELWFSQKLKKSKDEFAMAHNMFRVSIPKPFASLKIKEMTISQLYERYSQDKNFGLEGCEFLP